MTPIKYLKIKIKNFKKHITISEEQKKKSEGSSRGRKQQQNITISN